MLLQQLELLTTVLFLFLTDLWMDFSTRKKEKKHFMCSEMELRRFNTFLSIDMVIYEDSVFFQPRTMYGF